MRCAICSQVSGSEAFGPPNTTTIPHGNKCWNCYAEDRIKHWVPRFIKIADTPERGSDRGPDIKAMFDRDAYISSRGNREVLKTGIEIKTAFYTFLFRGSHRTVEDMSRSLRGAGTSHAL